MPKLKVLSGKEVIAIFEIFGFQIALQRGSHVKLTRDYIGNKQSLTIPNHYELDKGTLSAILRQASRFIPEDILRSYFYTEQI
jgi:predicted RNA binding protein YcfA (HicA-like mRNA interferase family)